MTEDEWREEVARRDEIIACNRHLADEERDELAHEICAAIGKAMDDAGVFVNMQVPLPGTRVVFIRGFGDLGRVVPERTDHGT